METVMTITLEVTVHYDWTEREVKMAAINAVDGIEKGMALDVDFAMIRPGRV